MVDLPIKVFSGNANWAAQSALWAQVPLEQGGFLMGKFHGVRELNEKLLFKYN